MLDLVGNPDDRFSQNEAQLAPTFYGEISEIISNYHQIHTLSGLLVRLQFVIGLIFALNSNKTEGSLSGFTLHGCVHIILGIKIIIHQSRKKIMYTSFEPLCEKASLRGFRPGPTQTRLYNHRI